MSEDPECSEKTDTDAEVILMDKEKHDSWNTVDSDISTLVN